VLQSALLWGVLPRFSSYTLAFPDISQTCLVTSLWPAASFDQHCESAPPHGGNDQVAQIVLTDVPVILTPNALLLPPVPLNEAPTAIDHNANTTEGAAVSSNLTDGASVGPPSEDGQMFIGGSYNASLLGNAHGNVTVDWALPGFPYTFTPDPGFAGAAQFTYTLQDNGGTKYGGYDTSGAQTVTIHGGSRWMGRAGREG
jgi:hypothetical protein